MSGEMSNYGVNSYTIGQVNDNTISLDDSISNAVDYGKKAVQGESHQDDKNWWQRTMDWIDNAKVSVREGFLNFFDAIGDLGMGIVGSIADAAGNQDLADKMKQGINTDWQAGALRAMDISFNPFDPKTYQAETYDLRNLGDLQADRDYINSVRYGNTNEGFDSFTTKVGNTAGNMIPSLVTGGAIGSAASAGATSMAAARMANISVQASLGAIQGAGSAYSRVASEDGDMAKGGIYALSNGLINGTLSAISGAFGSKAMNMGETLGSKIAGKAFSGVASETAKKVMSKALAVAVDVGWDTATDVAQEALDPFLRSVYDSEAVYNAYGTDENVKNTLDNLGKVALYSMATSVVRNSVSIVRDKATEYANREAVKTSEKLTSDPEFTKNAERAQAISTQAEAIVRRMNDVQTELQNATDGETIRDLTTEKQTLERKSEQLATEAKQIDDSMKEAYDTAMKASKKEVRNEVLGISEDTKAQDTAPTGVKALISDFEEKHPGRNAYSKIDEDLSYKVGNVPENGGKRVYFKAKSNDGLVTAISYSQQNTDSGTDISAMLRDLGGDMSAFENGTQRVTISTDDNALDSMMAFKDTIQNPENYTKVFNTEDGSKHVVYYDGDTDTPFIELEMKKGTEDQKEYSGIVRKSDSFSDSLKKVMGNPDVRQATNLPTGQADTDSISKAILSPILEQVRKARGKGTVATIDTTAQEKALTSANDSLFMAKLNGKDLDSAVNRYINALENLDISTADLSESTPTEFRGKISDYLGDDPEQRSEFETRIRSALKDVLDSVEIVPEEGNMKQNVGQAVADTEKHYKEIIIRNEAKYNASKNRLANALKEVKLRRDSIIDLYRAERTLKKKYDTSKGMAKSGAWDIPQKMNEVFANMAKTMTFTKSGKGLSPKSVEAIMNYAVQYGQETAGMLPVTDDSGKVVSYEEQPGSVYSPELENEIESLRSTMVQDSDGKWYVPATDYDGTILRDSDGTPKHGNSLTTEQMVTATNIYKMANKITGKAALAERRNFRIKSYTAYRQASDILNNLPTGFLKTVDKAGRNTQGFISQMSKLFGPSSSAYDTVVRKPVEDWNNLTHLRNAEQEYVDSAMDRFGVKEKDLSGKITIGDVELPKSNAMNLYAISLSEDYDLAKEVGVQYKATKDSVRTIKIDDDFINKVSESLTDGEKGFVREILENGYNGRMKQKLSSYSLKKTGVDITEGHEGLYLRRTRGDLRVEPQETVGNIGSMGRSVSMGRTKNKNPLVLGDFVNGYSDYVKQVGMLTELDDVRSFDRFMNMKPTAESDSVFTMARKNNESHVYDLFTDWQKRITNVPAGKTKPSAFTKTFNAAAGNMISFNPGTWFKELLDPIRMISDVGLKNFVKGTARGIMASVDPQTRETYKSMANSNAFYQAMNLDNWVVSENTIGATTSRWAKKTSVFTQGFENYMYKYLATPVYEQYVLSLHPNDPDYYIGSPKLTSEVTSKFETDSLMYLSNANKLDMSNLRAGAQGTFLKCFFGTFQGNQQKMLELIDSTLTGGFRSRNRQAAFEKGRDSAMESLSKAKKELDSAESAYKELVPDDNAYDRDAEGITKAYENAKIKVEALQRTVKDYDNSINAEAVYQKGTPKRIGAFAGSMVALAAGDVLISYLNSVARGSKELNKEDFLSKDNAEQMGLDIFVSWIPYVNVISSAFQYSSDLTAPQTQGITDSVDAVKAMVSAVSGTGTGYNAFLKSLDALSSVSGVPVSSVLKYFSGAVKNVGEWSGSESMYKLYTKMNGYNSTYLSKQMSDSLSRNNLTEATTELQSSMALFKTGSVSHNTAKELARLYGEGFNAIPKDYPTTDGKAGNEHFRDIYSESNQAVTEMMNQRVYSVLDDSDKAKAVRKIYDSYYETAEASVSTDSTEEKKSSKARMMIEGGMGNGLLGRVVLGSYYVKGMSSGQRYQALLSSGYSADEALLVIWYLGGKAPEGMETRMETIKRRFSLE